MRKIKYLMSVALIILVSVIFVNIAYAQNTDESGFLKSVGLINDEIAQNSNMLLEREELAYIVSRLYDSGELAAKETNFDDVNEDNLYSGYIDFAAEAGLIKASGGKFLPDGAVSCAELVQPFMKIMGYDALAELSGGFPNGYMLWANKLKWLKNTGTLNHELTKEDAVKIIYNAITLPYGEVDGISEISISDDKRTILTEKLGVSKYYATVTKTEFDENSLTAEITECIEDAQSIAEGSAVCFRTYLSNKGDYLYAPCELYVRGDEVIYICTQKNTEIMFEYIYSVNGDENESTKYRGDYINRITLYGDEKYNIEKPLNVIYNGKKTNAPVALAGKFARIVTKNGKVVCIESYDFKQGGLISEVGTTKLKYTNHNGDEVYMDIRAYEECRIYNDRGRTYMSYVKPGTTFSYYSSDETIVLITSEYVVTDTFIGHGGGEILIGGASYEYTKELLVGKDGKNFLPFDKYANLPFECEVEAYLNGKKQIVFINDISSKVVGFYAAVVGGEEEGTLNKKTSLLLKKIEDNTSSLYLISKKAQYEDGLTLSSIIESIGNMDGSCIYYFTLNSKGEIKKIEAPTYFLEISEPQAITEFNTNNYQYFYLGSRAIMTYGPYHVLVENETDEKFDIVEYQLSSLRDRTFNGVTMKLLAEKDNSNVLKYAVLCGETSEIYNKNSFLAMLNKIKYLSGDSDTEYAVAEFLARGTVKEYIITKEETQNLKKGHGYNVYFSTPTRKGGIYIKNTNSVMNMNGTYGEYETTSAFRSGTVRSIYSDRIILDDGSENGLTYFYHPGYFQIIKVGEEFSAGNINDIECGDLVYYYMPGGLIYNVFYEER